jgi:hypothetical protein
MHSLARHNNYVCVSFKKRLQTYISASRGSTCINLEEKYSYNQIVQFRMFCDVTRNIKIGEIRVYICFQTLHLPCETQRCEND